MPGMSNSPSSSTVMTDDLRGLPSRAADLIEQRGWVQHSEQAEDGRLISTGS